MNSRRLVQLTGLSLILLSGGYLTYTTLTSGKPYAVAEIDVPAPALGTTGDKFMLVADLACPHCRAFDSVKGKRLERQARSGRSQLAYMLVAFQEGSEVAGNAALCVFEQNPAAFWSYKSALYKLEHLTLISVTKATEGLALNARAFRQCVADRKYAGTLRRNERLVQAAGVRGTPTLITGGLAFTNPNTALLVRLAGE